MSKIKPRKMYQVRFYENASAYSKCVGFKMRLLDRAKASRVVKFLSKRGVDAMMAPMIASC